MSTFGVDEWLADGRTLLNAPILAADYMDLLAFREGDTLDDIFPGTGGMSLVLAEPPLPAEAVHEDDAEPLWESA